MRRSTATNIVISTKLARISASSWSACITGPGSTPLSATCPRRSSSRTEAPRNEVASRHVELGALPPNPQGFIAFFGQNGCFLFDPGDRLNLSPAFPAAEPVARVASQHCPIPSGSGRISINHDVRRLNQKTANGDYPLNLVSHVLVHR